MPSGVIRLRNSKKSQRNPRVGHEQRDISGYRGLTTRDDVANVDAGSDLAPNKPETFGKRFDVANTYPKPSDRALGKGGKEGKIKRHRQNSKGDSSG